MNDDSKDNKSGIGEIFKGLGRLVNAIVDMAEKNVNERKSTGDLFNSDNGNGLHGKYAFSMKLGLNEKDIGNIVRNLQVIEPQTDIFKEDGHTVVVIEMPGVKYEDFEYGIQRSSLNIIGKDSMKIYKKSMDIPGLNVKSDEITITENNGIYKIDIKHNSSE